MTKDIIILGYGQVGGSLGSIYNDYPGEYKVIPVDQKTDCQVLPTSCEVLHICIPFIDNFVEVVKKMIKATNPRLIVINSTVLPGTTKKLYDLGHKNIVQSPVMGIHPNLKEGMLTFKKIVGGYDDESVDEVINHFKTINIKAVKYASAEESELAKLLDTTYYGWNILYMKSIFRLCAEKGLTFDNVYTKTNEIYNEGYSQLGMSYVVRPILKPTKGLIGGHCVRPNMEILKGFFKPAAIGLIMDDKLSWIDDEGKVPYSSASFSYVYNTEDEVSFFDNSFYDYNAKY